MIKVSVIVPIFNAEEYLDKCLQSLLAQTLSDIEIICVNDGSTDKSKEILERYSIQDKRIKVINKTNGGQSSARNLGLEYASGEFVGYVDADDWIGKRYYERLYESAKITGSDIACGDIVRCGKYFSSKRLTYKKVEVSENEEDKYRIAGLPGMNYVWNKIYNREKLLSIGEKFVEGRLFEDIIWTIHVVYNMEKVCSSTQAVYYYRKNNKSTVSQVVKNKKSQEDMKKSWEEFYGYCEEKGIKLAKTGVLKKVENVVYCGVRVMKIYHWSDKTVYKLLGLLPVYVKRK